MREVSDRGQTRLCGLDLEMTSSGTDAAHLAASKLYLRANENRASTVAKHTSLQTSRMSQDSFWFAATYE